MKIKLLHENAIVPTRKTDGSAGYDLHALQTYYVGPKDLSPIIVRTGIALEIPEGKVGLVYVRSSRGKRGLYLANGTGVIDSDYRGELLLMMKNHSFESYQISEGEAVAQLVIVDHYEGDIEVVTELSDTGRSDNGFGSTDKKNWESFKGRRGW